MTSARAVLVQPDPSYAEPLRQALRRCALEASEVSDPNELAGARWDLVIVDYDRLSPAQRGVLQDQFRGTQRLAPLLLLSKSGCAGDLPALLGQRVVTNLINLPQLDGPDLETTLRKLTGERLFGLRPYFPREMPHEIHSMRRSTERAPLLAAAAAFTEKHGLKQRFQECFCMVAEEMLTNALISSPVDLLGKPRFQHLPPNAPVELEPHEHIEVTFACDGERLGIGVRDPFGSLSRERLLDYLAKGLRRGNDQIDVKQRGAGLGMYFLFESLTHLVVNVEPNRRTEFLGLMDVRPNYRHFASRGHSFNTFVMQPTLDEGDDA